MPKDDATAARSMLAPLDSSYRGATTPRWKFPVPSSLPWVTHCPAPARHPGPSAHPPAYPAPIRPPAAATRGFLSRGL